MTGRGLHAPSPPHDVLVIVSIDTEEDNWSPSREGVTLENIRELPRMAGFLERLGVRPTFFTTYQVAREPRAADAVSEACATSHGEIAAHLHPWNTPPLEEALVPRNSMLANLPPALQLAKLHRLTGALQDAFAHTPAAFRAGRYGLGPGTVAALTRCGYRVDSSVTPFISWEAFDEGPTFFSAPVAPYRLAPGRDVNRPAPDGDVLEVPLSCAFRRGPVGLWDPARRLVDAAPFRRLRLLGQAVLTGLLKRIILSPELTSVPEMLALSRRLLDQGVRHLQLSWHSPSLVPGLSPHVATAAGVAGLYASVAAYLEGLSRMTSVTFATLSEAAAVLGEGG